MKGLLIAGWADSLINFRGPLMAAMQARGVDVHVAAPGLSADDPVRHALEQRGVTVHSVPLARTGTSPLADLQSLWALWRLMRRVRPDFVLGYTAKPVIYGSLAAWAARVPRRHALITGLGYAFQGDGRRSRLRRIVQSLYRVALSKVHTVFFQNPDDLALFQTRGLLHPATPAMVVNGSGVDVQHFAPAPLPGGPACFLLVARLLGDKGVREYARAAAIVRRDHPKVRCLLVGWIDENPDAIAQHELNQWVADGDIEYLGKMADVRPAISACNVYVLPSYREGTPRTVLEAMAMGRPIITTDAPGCRETVVHGDNGLLVPVRSAPALAAAMKQLITHPEQRQQMGERARQIAQEKYDVHQVNAAMLEAMGLLSPPDSSAYQKAALP
ncbi:MULTISPECIES: glycosyltransferase family 4 protein [unclassified Acidovorax]|uniref:glycosyltransferase family 4 protein n=1 Tax=unclassified Acidovorax TaxID=2684926 RepID=UPI002883155C|nr:MULTISPECIES: glycosyltransferase family 4 protein [unclassified Acidovorax]